MDALHELQVQFKILILMVAGLLIIVGFRRQGLKLLYSAIIMAIIVPVAFSMINQLPFWSVALALLLASLITLKRMAGKEAWGQFIGSVMYDLLWKLPLRLLRGFGRQIFTLFGRQS